MLLNRSNIHTWTECSHIFYATKRAFRTKPGWTVYSYTITELEIVFLILGQQTWCTSHMFWCSNTLGSFYIQLMHWCSGSRKADSVLEMDWTTRKQFGLCTENIHLTVDKRQCTYCVNRYAVFVQCIWMSVYMQAVYQQYI